MNLVPHIPAPFTVVDLLIKLAVMALLAGFIARFSMFRDLLMIEQRGPREKIQFAAFLGLPFMVGVLVRLLSQSQYPTTDMSLEVIVLAGLLGGTIVGLAVALIVNLPILLIALWVATLSLFPAFARGVPPWLIPYYRPELLAPLMATLYAVAAGTARWVCPDKEEIWKFSPFFDLSLYRSIKQRFKHPAIDWQVLFCLICIILEIIRMLVVGPSPTARCFTRVHLTSGPLLIVLATLFGVSLPVRIWNTTRIEHKLVEQEKALLQARMDALISQINPHFLFNTLNTISSLIRFDPDTARTVLLKLSNILRRRLKAQVTSRPFSRSWILSTIIWTLKWCDSGATSCKSAKRSIPRLSDMVVPSMILAAAG